MRRTTLRACALSAVCCSIASIRLTSLARFICRPRLPTKEIYALPWLQLPNRVKLSLAPLQVIVWLKPNENWLLHAYLALNGAKPLHDLLDGWPHSRIPQACSVDRQAPQAWLSPTTFAECQGRCRCELPFESRFYRRPLPESSSPGP